jgi:hypothetical protein
MVGIGGLGICARFGAVDTGVDKEIAGDGDLRVLRDMLTVCR